MRLPTCLFALLIPAVFSLDCSGPIDIAVAVPGSYDAVHYSQFRYIEEFLHKLITYFNVDPSMARVALVLYGKEPVVVSNLEEGGVLNALNARATLLSQRNLFSSSINGGQNVPKAINAVHNILTSSRPDVPKVAIMMTYGSDDLTSVHPPTVAQEVASAASAALDDGIHIFATSTNGTVPGFMNITMDTCRLFSLGTYENLTPSLLPYLASTVCYVIDDAVTPAPGDCFPEIKQQPEVPKYKCKAEDLDTYLADPYNCAYMYRCPYERIKCASGTWFEPLIKRCTHYRDARCYNNLTCPAPYGYFSHPRFCDKYLICAQSVPHVMDCPSGLVFNPNKLYCDFPHNYDCSEE